MFGKLFTLSLMKSISSSPTRQRETLPKNATITNLLYSGKNLMTNKESLFMPGKPSEKEEEYFVRMEYERRKKIEIEKQQKHAEEEGSSR